MLIVYKDDRPTQNIRSRDNQRPRLCKERAVSPLPILHSIVSHPGTRRLVTNSSDRTLRQFNLPLYAPPSADGSYIEQELEPTYRFSDPINKVAWHSMSYSPDGEFLAGGESPAIPELTPCFGWLTMLVCRCCRQRRTQDIHMGHYERRPIREHPRRRTRASAPRACKK